MPSRWATKSAKQTSSRTAPLPERNHFCSEARRSMSSNPVSEEIGLFFFQAEDGIRYGHVTGVQTCALPIYPSDLIELLFELLPLKQCFVARQLEPPDALHTALSRMHPMLRFLRLGDGSVAHFNGMGPTFLDQV